MRVGLKKKKRTGGGDEGPEDMAAEKELAMYDVAPNRREGRWGTLGKNGYCKISPTAGTRQTLF